MPFGRLAPLVVVLWTVALGGRSRAAGVEGPAIPVADEQALRNAHLPATGPALVDFFRRRTPADLPPAALPDLIQQLGDRSPEAQARGFAGLVGHGSAAVPLLRQAANALDNPETAQRARRCLELIEGPEGAALVAAAARVLAILKPPGAAEALLGYLPYVEEERLNEEIMQALRAVALRDGKPEAVLLRSLEDPLTVRRAAAAGILSQVGGAECRPAVRKLLHDPQPVVRLRAALALAQANDAEAVPVLIHLLAELPAAQSKPIEEYLTQLAGEWALTVPGGADEVSRRLRRELWLAWWRGTDGTALLDEFKRHTLPDAEYDRVQGLIRQLNDVAAPVREKALADLLALGRTAVPLLRRAISDPNSPAREQAQKCLQLLDQSQVAPLPGAAARLVALRRPEGAVAVLLAYLPSAEDEGIADEIEQALAALAPRDDRPDPALLAALSDPVGVRRAAAVQALCRVGRDEERQQVRKLLHDPDPAVRLRTATALIAAGDRPAVPALIGLLTELPPHLAVQAEAQLRLLAAERAPETLLGTDAASAQKCRDAWQVWWREHGHTVDLARLDPAQRLLGYTLIVEQYSQARRSGRVAEIDAAGKLRWEILGLQTAFDAQIVPGERVLIVEQGVSRISERDLKGNILWQRQLNQPFAVQRLANGNTFLAGRAQLLELDRNGKEVFTYPRPNNDIMAAQKLRDGQIVFVTYAWNYTRLDAKGKEVRNFRLGPFPHYTNALHFLPADHVLVPEYNANRVVEYNPEGKRIWEASVNLPTGVQRLPNGNTLVSSAAGQRIVELNRAGKVVWEYKENFNPWRASRR